jgi:hypothetical protein
MTQIMLRKLISARHKCSVHHASDLGQTGFSETTVVYDARSLGLSANPGDFQALSSEVRMTEFQVILRAFQLAKCISLKADTDQQKANRANSFM